MERKLASIQTIHDIQAIEGKDRIQSARVLGWTMLIEKGQFKEGDLVVYVECDSILPEKSEFEFLRSRCWNDCYKGFRIKTLKFNKTLISQGICFPISILPKGNYKEDQDVTNIIGIKKYETPSERAENAKEEIKSGKIKKFFMKYSWFRSLFGSARMSWPSFIPHTDETRWQNIRDFKELVKDKLFDVREKLDGCVIPLTHIQTNKGIYTISEIVNNKLDVEVLSYNEQLQISEFKPVIDYHKIKVNRPMYNIFVGHRGKGNRPKSIKCTDNHKFLTDRGWLRADELNMSDTLCHGTKKISQDLKEIILGCLLGDASINYNTSTGAYRTICFGHSTKQSEYFDYKKKIFGNLFSEQKPVISGFGSTIRKGVLLANLSVCNYINSLLVEGKRVITPEIAKQISPISLAFWFMDDGSLSNRDKENLKCKAILNTQRYSYEEHLIIQKMFLEKYNIITEIGAKESYKGHVILFNTKNTAKLCSLIAPYICTSMKYKLPKEYKNMPCFFEGKTFTISDGVVPTKILNIEGPLPSNAFGNYVYDITVKDNSNYFGNNILLHNCSTTYFAIKNPKKWQFWKPVIFGVCSRNIFKPRFDNSNWWKVARQFDLENKMVNLLKDMKVNYLVIQAELVGEGVQGNKYQIKGLDLYVFNVFTDKKENSLNLQSNVCTQLELKRVPSVIKDFNIDDTVDLSELPKGFSIINPKVLREGLVFRNYENKISFKAISSEFLLRHDL